MVLDGSGPVARLHPLSLQALRVSLPGASLQSAPATRCSWGRSPRYSAVTRHGPGENYSGSFCCCEMRGGNIYLERGSVERLRGVED